MGDIENADMFAGVDGRFGNREIGILNGHFVARERHQFARVLLVQFIETGAFPEKKYTLDDIKSSKEKMKKQILIKSFFFNISFTPL